MVVGGGKSQQSNDGGQGPNTEGNGCIYAFAAGRTLQMRAMIRASGQSGFAGEDFRKEWAGQCDHWSEGAAPPPPGSISLSSSRIFTSAKASRGHRIGSPGSGSGLVRRCRHKGQRSVFGLFLGQGSPLGIWRRAVVCTKSFPGAQKCPEGTSSPSLLTGRWESSTLAN